MLQAVQRVSHRAEESRRDIQLLQPVRSALMDKAINAVTACVFKVIIDHAKEGGSFRYLIYDRLGFGSNAYVPLFSAGGMSINNEFDFSNHRDPDEV